MERFNTSVAEFACRSYALGPGSDTMLKLWPEQAFAVEPLLPCLIQSPL